MDITGYRLNIGGILCQHTPTLEAAEAAAERETEALWGRGYVVLNKHAKRWRAMKGDGAMDVQIEAVTPCQCCGGEVYAVWQPGMVNAGYWLVTCETPDCPLRGFTFSSPTYPLPPDRLAQYVRSAR